MSHIARECAGLSSGTIATLTGARLYSEIDAIQAALVAFALASSERWETWVDCWEAFKGANHANILECKRIG